MFTAKTAAIGLEIRWLSAQTVSVTGFPVNLRPQLKNSRLPTEHAEWPRSWRARARRVARGNLTPGLPQNGA